MSDKQINLEWETTDGATISFEGTVEYEVVDNSFDHEFGRETFKDLYIGDIVGTVIVTDEDGRQLDVPLEHCEECVKEKVNRLTYDELVSRLKL